MSRPGFRLGATVLPLLLAAVGCSSKPTPVKYPAISYGPADFVELAKSFLDEAAPNRPTGDLPLSFIDAQGKPVDLGKYKDTANVVLTVVKGLPQSPGGLFCPGCLAQMNSFAANVDGFKKRQAEVLVVFPGPSDSVNDFMVQAKAGPPEGKTGPGPVPLLLDKDMTACRRLDILGDWAKPSTYILDKKGKVVYAYVGEGTTDRPSVKALFAELDKLNRK